MVANSTTPPLTPHRLSLALWDSPTRYSPLLPLAAVAGKLPRHKPIAQVSSITHDGIRYDLPALSERTLSNEIGQLLQDIKRGRVEDTHNWIYRI